MKSNTALWVVQGTLAALFVFAGGMKLVMPASALAAAVPLPVPFMRFVAVAELLGGLGLILPGLLQRHTGLTPVAAAGLVVVMAGATVVTAATAGVGPAVFPLLVGALAALVARSRWTHGWGRVLGARAA